MSLIKSIATVSIYTMISRLLGFVRDMIIANVLGAGAVSDAFLVALKLPNLFRQLFAEGAFNAAFVPLFSGALTESKEKAESFASRSYAMLFIILLAFLIIMEIIMPFAMMVFAPGFDSIEGKMELATELTRIAFPFLLFVSLSSLQSGVLNSLGKFAIPAINPIILNITLILGAFCGKLCFPNVAYTLAFATSLAGIIQIMWLTYSLKQDKFGLSLDIKGLIKFGAGPEVRTLMRRIAPGILGAGIYQINLTVDTILVSLVSNGAVSWMYYANRLTQLPLGVIGVAISTALLPLLSSQIKQEKYTDANHSFNRALEFALVLTMPSAVAFLVIAEPMIITLFRHGQFELSDAHATAYCLMAYSFGLPAYVVSKVMMPAFFARGDTKTPVKIAGISFIFNFCSSVTLMLTFGYVGIAASSSISAWFSNFMYWRVLRKTKIVSFDDKMKKRARATMLSSIFMGLVLLSLQFTLHNFVPNWEDLHSIYKVIILATFVLVGGAAYLISGIYSKAIIIDEFKRALSRSRS